MNCLFFKAELCGKNEVNPKYKKQIHLIVLGYFFQSGALWEKRSYFNCCLIEIINNLFSDLKENNKLIEFSFFLLTLFN